MLRCFTSGKNKIWQVTKCLAKSYCTALSCLLLKIKPTPVLWTSKCIKYIQNVKTNLVVSGIVALRDGFPLPPLSTQPCRLRLLTLWIQQSNLKDLILALDVSNDNHPTKMHPRPIKDFKSLDKQTPTLTNLLKQEKIRLLWQAISPLKIQIIIQIKPVKII